MPFGRQAIALEGLKILSDALILSVSSASQMDKGPSDGS